MLTILSNPSPAGIERTLAAQIYTRQRAEADNGSGRCRDGPESRPVCSPLSRQMIKALRLSAAGVDVVDGMALGTGDSILTRFCPSCKRGVTRLMVNRAALASSFLREERVDELVWFRASALIGGDGLSAVRDLGLELLEFMPRFERRYVRPVGEDLLETYCRRL